MRRSATLLVCALIAAACGGEVGPPNAPVTLVAPPAASARGAAAAQVDPACPELLRAVEDSERDCPATLARHPVGLAEVHRLGICAGRIEVLAPRARNPRIRGTAEHIGYATRSIGSPELSAAAAELAGARGPATPGSQPPVNPVYALASRRRALSHAYLRAWCGQGTTVDQPEAWQKQVMPMLLGLQEGATECMRDAHARLPMSAAQRVRSHLDYRIIVELDGRPSIVSPVDLPGTMRADAALCIIEQLERMSFPRPTGRAVLGSNVTFEKSAEASL